MNDKRIGNFFLSAAFTRKLLRSKFKVWHYKCLERQKYDTFTVVYSK